MAVDEIDDDWRTPGHERYHHEIEYFRRRQQDNLRSDINHALIGRNTAIVVLAFFCLVGLIGLFAAVGNAYMELADLGGDRLSSSSTTTIVAISFAVGGGMVLCASFCALACARLFKQFSMAYSETAGIFDEGIERAKSSGNQHP